MTITTPILSFIEEIMIKYNLEDDLIEGDDFLKKQLSETTELSYRFSLKLMFGQKIKEQKMAGKSLEEILPSMRLKRIIESLIEKKSSYEDLPGLIKKDLNVDEAKAEEISNATKNNIDIIKLINHPEETEIETNDNESEKNIEIEKNPTKKSIANILLK